MPFALALVLLSTTDAVKEIREAMPSVDRAYAVIRKIGPGKDSIRMEVATSGDTGVMKTYIPEGTPAFTMSFDGRELRWIDFATSKTTVLTVTPSGGEVLEEAPESGNIDFRLRLTGAGFAVGEGVRFVKDSVRRGIKTYEFRRVATDEKLTVEFPVATRNPMTIRDHGKNSSRQTIQRRDLRPTDALTIPEDLWRAYHRG